MNHPMFFHLVSWFTILLVVLHHMVYPIELKIV